ncbi:MAG: NIL domain-containing protein [Cytophagales bacterium]|nr:NIL domain-containing protein [Armatimonadota bacterium]
MAQASEVYNLTFHREMSNSPILFNIGKRFRVTVNIRRAILSDESGWVEVQFSGPEEEIGRAVADLHTTGVIVTGPLTDLVEPDYEEYIAPSIGRGT